MASSSAESVKSVEDVEDVEALENGVEGVAGMMVPKDSYCPNTDSLHLTAPAAARTNVARHGRPFPKNSRTENPEGQQMGVG